MRTAIKEQDHKALVALAKTSKYTKDFSNEVMFSSEAAYAKGWIRLAENEDGEPIGFYCVRHKVRAPVTMLYFIVVHPDCRDHGVGELLMEDLEQQARAQCKVGQAYAIHLNVAKDNTGAIRFYERLGFNIIGDHAIKGTAFTMEYAV
jgi:ribosomal protein S18 acetylase RimI-like enzyme